MSGEKSRRSLEDLIGAAGFGKLALEALVLFLQGLGHRRGFCLGAVSVALQPQGLLTNADLRGDSPDRTRTRTSLDRLTFQNQSDRALTQLWTVLLGHVPILVPRQAFWQAGYEGMIGV